jgi:predicted RNA-binding Zn-ribbon protein involved in translation (DUF1610 family)
MRTRPAKVRRLPRRVYVLELACGKWLTTRSQHQRRPCPACGRHVAG